MQSVRVVLAETNRLLAIAELANTSKTRMVGLLGRDGLPAGRGLILDPCRLIHTFAMQFALDVVFYDRHFKVTRAVRHVRPARFCWGGLRARYTLEMQAGALAGFTLERGTQLRIDPA